MEMDYEKIPYWLSIVNEKQPDTWNNMGTLGCLIWIKETKSLVNYSI